MAEERIVAFPQNLTLEDRKTLTVTGVSDIGSFDEQTVVALTDMGELTVKGEDLHIVRMSVDMGELVVEGSINALSYAELQPKAQGLFSRLFR